MDDMELRTLGDAARVTEKLADFAGNIILQLMQKQGYVEKQGIEALLSHIKEGGGTLTSVVSADRAAEFGELLRKEHIPYVELEHTDPQTKERSVFFVYRDSDRERAKQVLKEFELTLDKTCHEVDLETFVNMTDRTRYGMVKGLTRAEVYAFREVARMYNMTFSVALSPKKHMGDKDRYAVVCDSKELLEDAVSDMCYDMSGVRGREYGFMMENHFRQERWLEAQMEPEPGKVKYLVNARNPSNFLTVDEHGITTHSVGKRPERGADGVIREVIYDCQHTTYIGYNRSILKKLALELKYPIVLSAEEFPLAHGLSKTGEAILSQDFVSMYQPFVKAMERREPDYQKPPMRKSISEREEVLEQEMNEKDALKIKNIPFPDVFSDVQKEARERAQEKKVTEQTMNREYVKVLLEAQVNRRMEQEPER